MNSIDSKNDSYSVKVGRAVNFRKYVASVVSLIFLPKTLICNKIMFRLSNSLNSAELCGK